MDNSSNQYWKVEEVLAHCSHQARRIKKLTRSANAFAKHTKTQGDKVQLIANEAAQAISSDFADIQFDSASDGTEKMQFQLEELLFKSQPKITDKFEFGSFTTGRYKESSEPGDSRLPTLPSFTFISDDMSNDEISDSGSDFFPDWSSIDSCTSSLCSLTGVGSSRQAPLIKENIYLNGEEFLTMQDNEMEIVIENGNGGCSEIINESDSLQDIFNKSECTMMILQPAPAAGNEVPGTSGQAPAQNSASALPSEEQAVKMKPSALRRVKSMIMDNDLQDGVETGKKIMEMQQKRIMSSMTAHPSPLLANDDIVQIKKSVSQTSATKYSLKRSRSNISAELSSAKRNNQPWYNDKESGIAESEDGDYPMDDGYLPT